MSPLGREPLSEITLGRVPLSPPRRFTEDDQSGGTGSDPQPTTYTSGPIAGGTPFQVTPDWDAGVAERNFINVSFSPVGNTDNVFASGSDNSKGIVTSVIDGTVYGTSSAGIEGPATIHLNTWDNDLGQDLNFFSDSFTYNHPSSLPSVENLEITYPDSGLFNASWDPAPGALSYYSVLADSDGVDQVSFDYNTPGFELAQSNVPLNAGTYQLRVYARYGASNWIDEWIPLSFSAPTTAAVVSDFVPPATPDLTFTPDTAAPGDQVRISGFSPDAKLNEPVEGMRVEWRDVNGQFLDQGDLQMDGSDVLATVPVAQDGPINAVLTLLLKNGYRDQHTYVGAITVTNPTP